MPDDYQDVYNDVDFQKLDPHGKRTVLKGLMESDTDYNALPASTRPAVLNKVLSQYPDAGQAPQGSIADYARQYQKTPYRFGGQDVCSGADCSGFTQNLMGKMGVSVPRTAAEQYTGGQRVDLKNLQPGDLVFKTNTYKPGISHVGVVLPGGKVANMASTKTGYQEDDIAKWLADKKTVGARRYLPGAANAPASPQNAMYPAQPGMLAANAGQALGDLAGGTAGFDVAPVGKSTPEVKSKVQQWITQNAQDLGMIQVRNPDAKKGQPSTRTVTAEISYEPIAIRGGSAPEMAMPPMNKILVIDGKKVKDLGPVYPQTEPGLRAAIASTPLGQGYAETANDKAHPFQALGATFGQGLLGAFGDPLPAAGAASLGPLGLGGLAAGGFGAQQAYEAVQQARQGNYGGAAGNALMGGLMLGHAGKVGADAASEKILPADLFDLTHSPKDIADIARGLHDHGVHPAEIRQVVQQLQHAVSPTEGSPAIARGYGSANQQPKMLPAPPVARYQVQPNGTVVPVRAAPLDASLTNPNSSASVRGYRVPTRGGKVGNQQTPPPSADVTAPDVQAQPAPQGPPRIFTQNDIFSGQVLKTRAALAQHAAEIARIVKGSNPRVEMVDGKFGITFEEPVAPKPEPRPVPAARPVPQKVAPENVARATMPEPVQETPKVADSTVPERGQTPAKMTDDQKSASRAYFAEANTMFGGDLPEGGHPKILSDLLNRPITSLKEVTPEEFRKAVNLVPHYDMIRTAAVRRGAASPAPSELPGQETRANQVRPSEVPAKLTKPVAGSASTALFDRASAELNPEGHLAFLQAHKDMHAALLPIVDKLNRAAAAVTDRAKSGAEETLSRQAKAYIERATKQKVETKSQAYEAVRAEKDARYRKVDADLQGMITTLAAEGKGRAETPVAVPAPTQPDARFTPEEQAHIRRSTIPEGWERTADIKVRPDIFQFRKRTVADFPNWNGKEAAKNPISVWIDHAGEIGEPGQKYVVNGHNRMTNADKFDVPVMRTRYIEAPTARAAKEAGAIENLLDSPRNDAVDVAHFLRSTNLPQGDAGTFLRLHGVNTQSKVMREAVNLSKLPPDVFDKVYQYSEQFPALKGIAAAIGEHFAPADQGAQFADVWAKLQQGQKIGVEQIAERAKILNEQRAAREQGGMDFDFGDVDTRVRVTAAVQKHFQGLITSGKGIAKKIAQGYYDVTGEQLGKADLAKKVGEVIDRTAHTSSPLGHRITETVQRIGEGVDEDAEVNRLISDLESTKKIEQLINPADEGGTVSDSGAHGGIQQASSEPTAAPRPKAQGSGGKLFSGFDPTGGRFDDTGEPIVNRLIEKAKATRQPVPKPSAYAKEISDLQGYLKTEATTDFQKSQAQARIDELQRQQEATRPTTRLVPRARVDASTIAPPKPAKNYGSMVREVLAVPQSLMSAGDLSGTLRQGFILTARHPVLASKAFGAQVKAMFSEKAYRAIDAEIRDSMNSDLHERFGLYLPEPEGGIGAREEAFRSRLAERIPLLGPIVRGSDRAYVTYLNKLRASSFDVIADAFDRAGIKPETDPKAYADLARFTNAASGRGTLGMAEKYAGDLAHAFWSPKLMASRVQLMNPLYYKGLHPAVRMEAAKSMAAAVTATVTMLALAKMAGAEVETDPRSTDFGQMKFGNTRIDLMAGFRPYFIAMARTVTGEFKSSKGQIYNVGEWKNGKPPETPDRTAPAGRFFEQKLAPVPSYGYHYLKGQDAIGQKFDPSAAFWQMLMPMPFADTAGAIGEHGAGAGALMGAASMLGAGVQTYNPKTKKTPETSSLYR